MMGTAVTTGLLTTSTIVTIGRGMLNSGQAIGDGVNAGIVNMYDGTDNTGKLIGRMAVPATAITPDTGFNVSAPVRFTVGLYIEITGTGAGAIIHWGGM